MEYSHLIHHDPRIDKAGICSRCGAPIQWEHVIEQDDGELVGYGSTCVKIVLGNAFDEDEARRQYQERKRWNEHVRRKVMPTDDERKSDEINNLANAYMDAVLADDEKAKQEAWSQLEQLGFHF